MMPTHALQSTMLAILGAPRTSYSSTCQPITNPKLARLIVLRDVGPFRVTGLKPAVESLARVMADIATEHADIYRRLGSAGMLCCRYVRGSDTAISNHSWGTAIDLTVKRHGVPVLDRRGDGKVMPELSAIAPVFERHGWFWGRNFRLEDAMHFEASDGLIRRWLADGHLDPAKVPT